MFFKDNKLINEFFNNFSWQFFEKIFGLLIAFIISIIVIRYLGPRQYGQWAYSLSYVEIFSTISTFGMQSILIRDFVAKSDNVNSLINNSIFIAAFLGLLSLIICVLSVLLFKQESLIVLLITVLSLANLFNIKNIHSYYFQSQMKSRYISYITMIILSIDLIGKLILVKLNCNLTLFSFLVLIESILSFLLYSLVLWKKFNIKVNFNIDIKVIKYLLRESYPLAISSIMVIVYMRIDQIIVRHFCGLEILGQFSVGIKLIEMSFIIPSLIATNIFPVLVSKFKDSLDTFLRYMSRLYIFMFYGTLFFSLLASFTGKYLISLLYGNKYIEAYTVFNIGIFSMILVSFGILNSLWLQINGLQRYAIVFSVIGVITCIVLNLYLVQQFGMIGAAYSLVITQFISAILVYLVFPKTRECIFVLLKSILFIERY